MSDLETKERQLFVKAVTLQMPSKSKGRYKNLPDSICFYLRLAPRDRLQFDQHLASYRRSFENGDQASLLNAMRFCCQLPYPLPDWLETAFLAAYTKIKSQLESGTWDSVFGAPHRHRHLPDLKHGNKVMEPIYWRTRYLAEIEGATLNAARKQIQHEIGVSLSSAKRYYDFVAIDLAKWDVAFEPYSGPSRRDREDLLFNVRRWNAHRPLTRLKPPTTAKNSARPRRSRRPTITAQLSSKRAKI